MKTQKTILQQAMEQIQQPAPAEPTLIMERFDVTLNDIVTVTPISTDSKPNSPSQTHPRDTPTISTSELKQCPANP